MARAAAGRNARPGCSRTMRERAQRRENSLRTEPARLKAAIPTLTSGNRAGTASSSAERPSAAPAAIAGNRDLTRWMRSSQRSRAAIGASWRATSSRSSAARATSAARRVASVARSAVKLAPDPVPVLAQLLDRGAEHRRPLLEPAAEPQPDTAGREQQHPGRDSEHRHAMLLADHEQREHQPGHDRELEAGQDGQHGEQQPRQVLPLLRPLDREDPDPGLDETQHGVAEAAQRAAPPAAMGLGGFGHGRAQRRAIRTPSRSPAAAATPTAPHGCSRTYSSVVLAASFMRPSTSSSIVSSLARAVRSDSSTRARTAAVRSPAAPAVARSSSSESAITALRSVSSCCRAAAVASVMEHLLD